MGWLRVGIFWKLFLSILASMVLSFVIITFLYLELTPTTPLRPHIKNTHPAGILPYRAPD